MTFIYKNDIYLAFIAYLKTKKYLCNTKLEKHRILPQHAGGTYERDENVVRCSFDDHLLAHYYRFLAYRQKGDLIAYKFMKGMNEEARLEMSIFAGKLGGKKTSTQNKAKGLLFFNKEWQKNHGFKNAGKRNVDSGWLTSLNKNLSLTQPNQRRQAGILGGKARIIQQKKTKTGFYTEKNLVQKKGNLVRWGIRIDGITIPFKNLSSTFVDYHLLYGTKTAYNNPHKKADSNLLKETS